MNPANGKLISRKDLEGSDQSSEESDVDSDIDQGFRQVLNQKLGIFKVSDENSNAVIEDDLEENEEDQLEFRLFSGPQDSVAKIRVKSPDLGNGPIGFVIPNRPRSYYFKDSIDSQEQSNFESVALSGKQILSLSNEPWPGCSLPWRVQVVRDEKRRGKIVHEIVLGHGSKMEANAIRNRRTKPGKKIRIAKRKKAAAVEMQRSKLAEKETALREKKTKKNRMQKLKRREKKRNEKLAAAGGVADVQDEELSPT